MQNFIKIGALLVPKIVIENQKMEKNDFKNCLLAGDMAMLWQGRMNQGPKFLLVTVVDAQKKFHDPESIFWVSNNTFLETVRVSDPKLQNLTNFGLFSS